MGTNAAVAHEIELVPKEKRSLIATMAEKYGLEPAKFLETIKSTVFPKDSHATNEQLAAFLMVAHKYNLDPFTREIYAFPGRNGGIVPIVSVDGWATLLNRQTNLDGVEFSDNVKDGTLFSITCRIYRKDRSRPTEVTEYLKECSRNTEPWQKYPVRMLRHKALIQCTRYAFGLTGIVDEDEAERIAEGENGRHKVFVGTREADALDAEASEDRNPEQKARIHALCVKLGYNQARENMLLGQNAKDLAQLERDLTFDLENGLGEKGAVAAVRTTEGGSADTPAKRADSKQPDSPTVKPTTTEWIF